MAGFQAVDLDSILDEFECRLNEAEEQEKGGINNSEKVVEAKSELHTAMPVSKLYKNLAILKWFVQEKTYKNIWFLIQ